MNKDEIISQIDELLSMVNELPIANAIKFEIQAKISKIKDSIVIKEYQETAQKLSNNKCEEFQDDNMVDHPTHYQSYNNDLKIECIDAMRAAFGDEHVKAFCICNAIKYLYRCYSKGRNIDVKKAIWYQNKFLEMGGCE